MFEFKCYDTRILGLFINRDTDDNFGIPTVKRD